jgi:hypothetical protein
MTRETPHSSHYWTLTLGACECAACGARLGWPLAAMTCKVRMSIRSARETERATAEELGREMIRAYDTQAEGGYALHRGGTHGRDGSRLVRFAP